MLREIRSGRIDYGKMKWSLKNKYELYYASMVNDLKLLNKNVEKLIWLISKQGKLVPFGDDT